MSTLPAQVQQYTMTNMFFLMFSNPAANRYIPKHKKILSSYRYTVFADDLTTQSAMVATSKQTEVGPLAHGTDTSSFVRYLKKSEIPGVSD